MKIIPTKIERKKAVDSAENGLVVTWSNGSSSFISSLRLRSECPCAHCRELAGDTSHSKPLQPKPLQLGKKNPLQIIDASINEATDIKLVSAVGNYAIKITWGDRHDDGIYHYELLQELAS